MVVQFSLKNIASHYKKFLLCNHSICDYMQLFIICNYVLLFLQLVTILLIFLLFLWLWWTTKLYILPYWLTSLVFHPRINPYVHLVTNLVVTWLLFVVCLYILWALPQVWEIAKEVSPKHFQLGSFWELKFQNVLNLLGNVNKMNLTCLWLSFNIIWLQLMLTNLWFDWCKLTLFTSELLLTPLS
jgi:hypothetical protein